MSGMYKYRKFFGLCMLLLSHAAFSAQSLSLDDLKALSIDELSALEVGIASKIPTRVNETPAAVFVLTSEDLRRSGATSVPEALRIVPGLNVAAVSGNSWAVSSRGFNETFANKFLVLLDGRSLYSNTLGGVYWDMQDVRMEDIERIEVIRGPGSAVWGANAMNGVINIITRSSFTTQGGEVVGTLGNQHREAGLRYGGEWNENTSYRFSAKILMKDENSPTSHSGFGVQDSVANDDARHTRLSFRTDTDYGNGESLLLDAGFFRGESDQRLFTSELDPLAPDFATVVLPAINDMRDAGASQQQIFAALAFSQFGLCSYCMMDIRDNQSYEGGHLLARWRQVTDNSWQSIQAYLDYTQREDYQLDQRATAVDIDYERGWQNSSGKFAWGVGIRSLEDDLQANLSPTSVVPFGPASQRNNTYNAFVQSELNIATDLRVLTGVGYEYSSVSGNQWQPSIRGVWSANPKTQLWSSVSYSSRVPSRAETSNAPAKNAYEFTADPAHGSEKLTSFELGFRYSPDNTLTFDVAAFRYWYSDLTTIKIERPFNPFLSTSSAGELSIANDADADAYGAELAVRWTIDPDWRLQASYSWLQKSIGYLPALVEPMISANKAPEHQLSLRSSWDLSSTLELDLSMYYVSKLHATGSDFQVFGDYGIDEYVRTDVRLGWQVSPEMELSIIGQNLLNDTHQEFSTSPLNVGGYPDNTEINRSISAKLTVRF
ncbi:TonB-dependent receptor plug domain-containing protein [Neptunomonas antarctica]|uniref:Iron complex outermembrane recepter protein n=1 Tax=Neptunomonas antarctica TaxID=619304 RepID=A0A1N7NLW6_9GAMM|nr:TonB-dependent receptor [Neptunomonas antarctica]SIS99287.1 iron complex outermembrane recepter protein [Neptunomonas antarctica]